MLSGVWSFNRDAAGKIDAGFDRDGDVVQALWPEVDSLHASILFAINSGLSHEEIRARRELGAAEIIVRRRCAKTSNHPIAEILTHNSHGHFLYRARARWNDN